ncbi:hypothetical protein K402DRAFT_406469 [Aulographum hederae CBS 113979]|uniref:Uncharacterized protein n=1 Tax=Aulographum hederae CBS 113979 TaxID=1176131 RepID=A0A6G1GT81_9PEZI|nr:hypothetical protein K402DRAFT_406469 [Aulographum hederae CBS 113979]
MINTQPRTSIAEPFNRSDFLDQADDIVTMSAHAVSSSRPPELVIKPIGRIGTTLSDGSTTSTQIEYDVKERCACRQPESLHVRLSRSKPTLVPCNFCGQTWLELQPTPKSPKRGSNREDEMEPGPLKRRRTERGTGGIRGDVPEHADQPQFLGEQSKTTTLRQSYDSNLPADTTTVPQGGACHHGNTLLTAPGRPSSHEHQLTAPNHPEKPVAHENLIRRGSKKVKVLGKKLFLHIWNKDVMSRQLPKVDIIPPDEHRPQNPPTDPGNPLPPDARSDGTENIIMPLHSDENVPHAGVTRGEESDTRSTTPGDESLADFAEASELSSTETNKRVGRRSISSDKRGTCPDDCPCRCHRRTSNTSGIASGSAGGRADLERETGEGPIENSNPRRRSASDLTGTGSWAEHLSTCNVNGYIGVLILGRFPF